MTEKKLWTILRNLLGDKWHGQRLEDRLSVGVPDIMYAIHGVQGVIELKVVDRPGKTIRITNFQRSWLKKHGDHGNRSFLLVWAYESNILALFSHTVAYNISNMQDSKNEALLWCHTNKLSSCINKFIEIIG